MDFKRLGSAILKVLGLFILAFVISTLIVFMPFWLVIVLLIAEVIFLIFMNYKDIR